MTGIRTSISYDFHFTKLTPFGKVRQNKTLGLISYFTVLSTKASQEVITNMLYVIVATF